MQLARLRQPGDEHLTVLTDKGSNAGLKLVSLVAGMAAGANSIDDMARLRQAGMGKFFDGPCALRRWVPSCTSSPSDRCAAIRTAGDRGLARDVAHVGRGGAGGVRPGQAQLGRGQGPDGR